MAIFGLMTLTYAYVVVLFILSMVGIFYVGYETSESIVVAVFGLYIILIAFLWYKGHKVADKLRDELVEKKLKEEEADLM
jgi:putative effector of murein hydrolase